MIGLLDSVPLTVFRQRTPGDIRLVELRAGPSQLVVAFEVPDGLALAEAEAKAQEALSAIRQNPEVMERYGFGDRALSDDQIMALSRLITATETAMMLWKDWNFALAPEPGEEVVKAALTSQNIAHALSAPDVRAAWLIHLDNASPLEAVEGNGSGVSPITTTDGAPTTAEHASPETPPAAEGDAVEPGASAPEH